MMKLTSNQQRPTYYINHKSSSKDYATSFRPIEIICNPIQPLTTAASAAGVSAHRSVYISTSWKLQLPQADGEVAYVTSLSPGFDLFLVFNKLLLLFFKLFF